MSKQFSPPQWIRFEELVASCGHTIQFGLLDDKKDKFRNQRRERDKNRPCPECRRKAHRELITKQQEQAKLAQESRATKAKELPDGTKTHMSYSSKSKKWSGTMLIPQGEGIACLKITAQASSLANLAIKLWDKWSRMCAQAKLTQTSESDNIKAITISVSKE